jgi:hypothetical protein
MLALAATFGLASVLQGYATAPASVSPAPVASTPGGALGHTPVGRPSPGEQGRSLSNRRA